MRREHGSTYAVTCVKCVDCRVCVCVAVGDWSLVCVVCAVWESSRARLALDVIVSMLSESSET